MDTHDATSDLPLAAAIVDDGSARAEDLLAAEAQARQRAGLRVRGLLMTRPCGSAGCAADMVLVDVAGGESFLVSQPTGRDATACRADPQGFARASRVLHAARGGDVDLVVCNRFGSLESEGGGFAAELLALMADGVPLLTTVSARLAEHWTRFTGGAALLPAETGAVSAWVDRALVQAGVQGGSRGGQQATPAPGAG